VSNAAVPSWNCDVVASRLPPVRLSKIDDYLADIFCVSILSDVAGVRVKQKAGGLLARFQNGNLAPSLSATDAEPGGAAASIGGAETDRAGLS
jgi:hypothetical protein